MLSTVVMAALPKCPFCFSAWLAALSPFTFTLKGTLLITLELALLAVPVCFIAVQGVRSNRVLLVPLAVLAAACMIVGKRWLPSNTLEFGGATLLLLLLLWSSRLWFRLPAARPN
jgi:hypothetical protein